MVNAELSIFVGGTNVLAATFQDVGLVIPSDNPLHADLSGRIPLFFVADGTYKVRLTDQFGDITNGGFEYPQCPSIGASSSGGGGTPVDATTIFNTGYPLWMPQSGTLSGFTRMNGRTIGSATSGASEAASSTCQAQFLYLYNTFPDSICPVVGGRGANALADWNANKQITTIDMRGRGPFGLSDMGNADTGIFNGNVFNIGNGTTPAATLGEPMHTLTPAESAVLTYNSAVHEDPHTHVMNGSQVFTAGGNQTGITGGGLNNANTQAAITNLTVSTTANAGNGAHNTMSLARLGTWYMKK